MVADTDATQGSWVSARQLGALGMVKTGPLRYVSSHHVTEHGSISNLGQYTVDERWWICPSDGILPVHPRVVAAPEKLHSPFVHHHAHSEFSPLDGLATVQEMVDEAVIHNQMAIAVTDHGYCAAHPHLQKVANAAGIRPIFGLEANLVPNRFEQTPEIRKGYWHFLLLARNEVGLRNLWAASTEAHRDGYWYRPRMDWTTLQRHSEGMIASTACLRGPLKDLILSGDDSGARAMIAKMRAIFPESLYLELHTNHIPEQIELNRALVQLGQEMSLPLISVCDAHNGKCEDHDLHKVWIAAQTDRDLNADSDLFHGHEHYFLKSADQVAEALRTQGLSESAITESMQNTVEIANQCDATIRQGNAKPVYAKVYTNNLLAKYINPKGSDGTVLQMPVQ
jgi:DNA polymerase-3 subunit alpha